MINVLIYQILSYTLHGKVYQSNNFKMSVPSWNDKFEFLDESYYVWDVQDVLECIIKKHETVTDNPPIRIYKTESKYKTESRSKLKQRIISRF